MNMIMYAGRGDRLYFSRFRVWILGFLLLAQAGLSLPVQAQNVDCSSNLWKPTLFCGAQPDGAYLPPVLNNAWGKAFSARMLYSNPDAVPAQGWNPVTDLRCADGTEPFMYMDEGQGTARNWVFFFQGGGTCNPSGTTADDSDCAQRYVAEAPEFSSHLAKRSVNLSGILSPLPAENPFASYNRIKLDKCSYDRYMGRNTSGVALASDPTKGVFQAGYPMLERMLGLLDSNGGVAYRDCSDSGGNCVADVMPQLCQPGAQKFIFVGHSDGAHGLIHNIDKLVDLLKQKNDCADAEDEYFAVIDAQFIPMTENECKYDPAGCDACAAGLGNSIYCKDGVGQDVAGDSWDDDYFSGTAAPGQSRLAKEYAEWGGASVLDSSCLAEHAVSGDQEKCADRFHVLANHVSTPFFVRESLGDVNKEHMNGGNGHYVTWRNSSSGQGWNIDNWNGSSIYVLKDPAGYAARVVEQAGDFTDSTQNQYADEPARPPMRFFLPACINHEGVAQTETFNNMLIDGISYQQALSNFVNLPNEFAAKVWSDQGGALRDCKQPPTESSMCFPVKISSGETAIICL